MTVARSLGDPQFAIYGINQPFITGLQDVVDTYTEETHEITITKTDYPVETGSSNTDNAVREPDRLKLEGWVSDVLIPESSIVNVPNGRNAEAWSRIRQIAEAREPISVVTNLRNYDNMIILKVTHHKSVRTGQALRFTIQLEELLFASTQITRFAPNSVEGPAANKTSEVDLGLRQCPATEGDITTINDITRIRESG